MSLYTYVDSYIQTVETGVCTRGKLHLYLSPPQRGVHGADRSRKRTGLFLCSLHWAMDPLQSTRWLRQILPHPPWGQGRAILHLPPAQSGQQVGTSSSHSLTVNLKSPRPCDKPVPMPRQRNVCPSGPYRRDAPSRVSPAVWLLSSQRGLTTRSVFIKQHFHCKQQQMKTAFQYLTRKISLNVYGATRTWDSQQVLLWNLTRFGPQCRPDMPRSAFASYKNVTGLNISGFTAAETLQCHLSPLLWLSHNLKFSWIQRAACRQLILKTELCVKLGGKKRRKKRNHWEGLAGNTNISGWFLLVFFNPG